MNNKQYGVPVERLNKGKPVLSPIKNWWEDGVTFNTTCYYLEPSTQNNPIIRKLLDVVSLNNSKLKNGIVVLFYRARPKKDPGHKWNRSFIGLAVFTPDMKLLKRFKEPILSPGKMGTDFDCLGVEDARITRIGNFFYLVHCGVGLDPKSDYSAKVCVARSEDLLHWKKLGPIKGTVNSKGTKNKDGVLFPEKIDNYYYLLHRPYSEKMKLSDFSIHLARSKTLNGKWENCGEILHSFKNPKCRDSWVGAGSVPINLGDKKYLVIYHTGNYINDTLREYDLDVALFDFNQFNPKHPSEIVTKRLEPFMVPETEAEIKAPYGDSVANVLFICGSYEYKDYIYMVYGGGDTYTMAARVKKKILLQCLDECDTRNPF